MIIKHAYEQEAGLPHCRSLYDKEAEAEKKVTATCRDCCGCRYRNAGKMAKIGERHGASVKFDEYGGIVN